MVQKDFSSIKEEKEHSSSESESSSVERKQSIDHVEEDKEEEEGLSPPIKHHEISTKKLPVRRV